MTEAATIQQPQRILDLRVCLNDLVADGYLTREEANLVAGSTRSQKQSAMHPLSYIADRAVPSLKNPGQPLTEDDLTRWLAQKSGHPVYHIDPIKMNVVAVTSVMSYAYAKRHQVLCVENTPDYIVVACAQPFMSGWEPVVEQTAKKSIQRVVAAPSEIARLTVELYNVAQSVSDAVGKNFGQAGGLANLDQMLKLGDLKDPEANDQHVVNIVDWLMQYAFSQRASDIHIEPRRDQGRVRFRIDGVLHLVYELPANALTAVTSRLKILARMNIAEKRKPQDGRLKTINPEGREVELRLSTMPTAFGEKLVMRIFDPDVLLKTFAELGLANEDYRRWESLTSHPNGIVLVTGPTGSGKTTTLYSTLRQLATPEVNVSTIEDPIEMVVESFNQMQVQAGIGLDFATGVRTLMRQDPDIIMVGEIRDMETAQMAIQAALTGHLVLSTLHTNDAPSSITRLVEIGVPAYLIKATMLGIVAQRLVRTLCPHCKEKMDVDIDAWEQLTKPWKVAPPPHICRPVGCLKCRDTGYLGRQGIYEILTFSETVKNLITEQTDISKLRAQAMREGMRTLRLSGAQKIAAGMTTIEEVMRVAPAAEK